MDMCGEPAMNMRDCFPKSDRMCTGQKMCQMNSQVDVRVKKRFLFGGQTLSNRILISHHHERGWKTPTVLFVGGGGGAVIRKPPTWQTMVWFNWA